MEDEGRSLHLVLIKRDRETRKNISQQRKRVLLTAIVSAIVMGKSEELMGGGGFILVGI